MTFREGYIQGIYGGQPWQKLVSNLGVSSKDTGWFSEMGEVESFEVVSDGPVCTEIRVEKKLAGGHHYDKLYTLFPDHFLVSILSHDRFGHLSRMHVVPDGVYLDDKGLTAVVDGKGDGEGIAGRNPQPKWFTVHGPGWAVTSVAVTPFGNMVYWDAGNKAAVGVDGPAAGTATIGYYVGQAGGKEVAEAEWRHGTGKVGVE